VDRAGALATLDTAGVKGRIRVGIGGWTYAPWHGTFYPEGLPQKRELEYAASKLDTIEINGTFYGSQKPATFAKWRDETPADFVFAVKAPRYATHRRKLGEAGPTIERFVHSGLLELGNKLGAHQLAVAADDPVRCGRLGGVSATAAAQR
jgi:uncharacterized protein YecE (DUF72 family)